MMWFWRFREAVWAERLLRHLLPHPARRRLDDVAVRSSPLFRPGWADVAVRPPVNMVDVSVHVRQMRLEAQQWEAERNVEAHQAKGSQRQTLVVEAAAHHGAVAALGQLQQWLAKSPQK
jgi:hypothetical protein